MTNFKNKSYLLVAIMFVLLPYTFFAFAIGIARDSGVFMYTGLVIAEGGMPYIDSWDHKGPLLYLLNSVGFWFLGGARGVIALEGVMLFIALLTSMHLWSRVVSTAGVMVAAFLLMTTFYATFEGGNLTESWLLPFLLVTYSVAFVEIYGIRTNGQSRFFVFLAIIIGVSLAVAALTRLNNAMGLILLVGYLLFYSKGRRVQLVILISISFLSIVGPVLLWLTFNDAFRDFVDQYLVFNFAYSSGTELRTRLVAAYYLLKTIFFSPLGLVSIFLGLHILLISKNRENNRNLLLTVFFTVIFCIDTLSQLTSGNGYLHYISLTSAALTLVLISLLSVISPNKVNGERVALSAAVGLILLLTMFLILGRPLDGILEHINSGVAVKGNVKNDLASHLASKTTSQDRVLIHGAETWLLVAADRRSPTSVTYLLPTALNFRNALIKYEKEVISKPPRYIIEAPSGCGLTRKPCTGLFKKYSKINSLLSESYEKETELHDYVFWRLK